MKYKLSRPNELGGDILGWSRHKWDRVKGAVVVLRGSEEKAAKEQRGGCPRQGAETTPGPALAERVQRLEKEVRWLKMKIPAGTMNERIERLEEGMRRLKQQAKIRR